MISMKNQPRWILKLLVALATMYLHKLPSLSHANVPGKPSVYFIESPVFGDLFMAPNMTIDRTKAFVILTGLNDCSCRAACISIDKNCKAWSVTTLENKTSECRLADFGPGTTVPYEEDHAKYFFRKSSIKGKYVFGTDNLLYLEMVYKYKYEEAKRRCARIPGHRLIIIKSKESYDYFTSLGDNTSPFWVADLQKINESYFVWGDGTTYQDSGLGPSRVVSDDGLSGNVFVSLNSVLDDKDSSVDGPFRVVCQANPRGIEW